MEDLSAMRPGIVLGGSEADLDAHDARLARARGLYQRALDAIERHGASLRAGEDRTDGVIVRSVGDGGTGPAGNDPT